MDDDTNRRYSVHSVRHSDFSDDLEPEDCDSHHHEIDQHPEDVEPDPISEDDYYSEDFEQFEQDDDGHQDQEPLPPPYRSPRDGNGRARATPSDNAIVVFKSTTGPRLTIQPKKTNAPPPPIGGRLQQARPFSEINVRGAAANNGPKKVIPPNSSLNQKKQIGGGGVILVGAKKPNNVATQKRGQVVVKGQENAGHLAKKASTLASARGVKQNRGGGRNLVQASASSSSCRLTRNSSNTNPYNYRVKTNPYLQSVRLMGQQNKVATGSVTQRVASAKRMTINELKNRIAMLIKDTDDLRKENRCLRVCQNRQSLALKKFEGHDAQLPRLLQQHKDEIKSTHIQLKKALLQCRELDEKSKFKDRKMAKMEVDLASLRNLAKKDNLLERNDLQGQVDILTSTVSGCEKKIRQYMRHVEIIENNHKHQIAAEKQKLIKAHQHAMDLRSEITALKMTLRDKERMINYIQMRSAGRNLMKSFQEKERLHNTKLDPAVICPDGDRSPRSRSLSPQRNPISGRTYRAKSLDRTGDFSPESEIILQSRRASLQNSPRDRIPDYLSTEELPMSSDTQGQGVVGGQKGKGDHLQHPVPPEFKQNQNEHRANPGEDSHGGGDASKNFKNHQSQTTEPESVSKTTDFATSTGPMKNEYAKISKMLEANYPRIKAPKVAPPTYYLKADEITQTDAPNPKGQRTKPWAPTKLVEKVEPQPEKKKPQPKPQPMPTFTPSTGPKTHNEAKQEMKLQQAMFRSMSKSNILVETEDVQKQRKTWEKAAHYQTPSRPPVVTVPRALNLSPRLENQVPQANVNMPEYSNVQVQAPSRQVPLTKPKMAETPPDEVPVSNRSNSSNIQFLYSPRSDYGQPPEQEASTNVYPPMSDRSNYSNVSFQSELAHSPRDLMGIPSPHQFRDKVQPILTTSAKESFPRGTRSTPQMQDYPSPRQQQDQQFGQVRGIYSIPLVGQQEIQIQKENLQQKSVFSCSNGVPHIIPQQTNPVNLSQPMNMPFFSAGDGPQHVQVAPQHSSQPLPTHVHKKAPPPPIQSSANRKSEGYQNYQKPLTRQRSSTNQQGQNKPVTKQTSATKQASHIYNPSFFTKLGTWK